MKKKGQNSFDAGSPVRYTWVGVTFGKPAVDPNYYV